MLAYIEFLYQTNGIFLLNTGCKIKKKKSIFLKIKMRLLVKSAQNKNLKVFY